MPHHVVVDGSNLATEGRTQPSLKQLNEAVLAYMEEDPTALITVVVDATFGHRIDQKEVAEFDEAVSNNELVAPPAGAVGRGDAFVLSIANKVSANILSNDSFQEFHAQYDWLFEEGRLIGGKPVPHIGWVFVNRLPVRGPLSRKVTSEAKRKAGGTANTRGRGRTAATDVVRMGSPEANLPMPVPKSPPPRAAAKAPDAELAVAGSGATAEKALPSKGRRSRGGGRTSSAATTPAIAEVAAAAQATQAKHTVNDLLSFLTFIERHPAGTSVNAVVDHYSSHGAYVRIGEVVGYVPLRLMADPAPRSAREFMKVGESVTLVVESLVPAKRSIDLAVPGMGSAAPLGEPAPAKLPKKAAKRTAPKKAAVATKAPARKVPAKKASAPEVAPGTAPPKTPAKKAPAKQAAAKKAPAERVPAKKAPAEMAPARKAPAKKTAAKKTAAKRAAATTPPAKAASAARRGRSAAQ